MTAQLVLVYSEDLGSVMRRCCECFQKHDVKLLCRHKDRQNNGVYAHITEYISLLKLAAKVNVLYRITKPWRGCLYDYENNQGYIM